MNSNIDYSKYFSSPELLAKVVLEQYTKEVGELKFPINPFKILKNLNVKIVIRNFKELEGLYLPAKDEQDIDLVAINLNRPLYRQRFTAAHEICHCIKDKKNNNLCPINGKKNNIEALNKVDKQGDYDYLEILILDQMIESMVILDEKLEL